MTPDEMWRYAIKWMANYLSLTIMIPITIVATVLGAMMIWSILTNTFLSVASSALAAKVLNQRFSLSIVLVAYAIFITTAAIIVVLFRNHRRGNEARSVSHVTAAGSETEHVNFGRTAADSYSRPRAPARTDRLNITRDISSGPFNGRISAFGEVAAAAPAFARPHVLFQPGPEGEPLNDAPEAQSGEPELKEIDIPAFLRRQSS